MKRMVGNDNMVKKVHQKQEENIRILEKEEKKFYLNMKQMELLKFNIKSLILIEKILLLTIEIVKGL